MWVFGNVAVNITAFVYSFLCMNRRGKNAYNFWLSFWIQVCEKLMKPLAGIQYKQKWSVVLPQNSHHLVQTYVSSGFSLYYSLTSCCKRNLVCISGRHLSLSLQQLNNRTILLSIAFHLALLISLHNSQVLFQFCLDSFGQLNLVQLLALFLHEGRSSGEGGRSQSCAPSLKKWLQPFGLLLESQTEQRIVW